MGVNAFRAGGPGREPEHQGQAGADRFLVWTRRRKRRRRETLTNLGCDIVTAAYRQPGRAASLGEEEAIRFGQCRRHVRASRRHAQLTAIENIWGPYTSRARRRCWTAPGSRTDAWWGIKEGSVVISAYNKGDARQCPRGGPTRSSPATRTAAMTCSRPDLGSGPARRGCKGREVDPEGPRHYRLVREGRSELIGFGGNDSLRLRTSSKAPGSSVSTGAFDDAEARSRALCVMVESVGLGMADVVTGRPPRSRPVSLVIHARTMKIRGASYQPSGTPVGRELAAHWGAANGTFDSGRQGGRCTG